MVDKGGGMETERDYTWGDGHMMQCADVVLLSHTVEIYLVL